MKYSARHYELCSSVPQKMEKWEYTGWPKGMWWFYLKYFHLSFSYLIFSGKFHGKGLIQQQKLALEVWYISSCCQREVITELLELNVFLNHEKWILNNVYSIISIGCFLSKLRERVVNNFMKNLTLNESRTITAMQWKHFFNFWDNLFDDRWFGNNVPYRWPSRSLDLVTVNYFMWDYIKNLVHANSTSTIDDYKNRMGYAFESINMLCQL